MFKTFTAAVFSAVFTACANAQLTPPGDLCCNLYPDSNYGGTPKSVCAQATAGDKTFLLKDLGIANMVSSWFCGRSVSYDFCTAESGDCAGENGISGAGYI